MTPTPGLDGIRSESPPPGRLPIPDVLLQQVQGDPGAGGAAHPVEAVALVKPLGHQIVRGAPQPQTELVKGPNITDYPEMKPLPDHLLLKMCAVIKDPVTTTDELIPSGETSSLRSNPLKLAQFTLSRKAPDFSIFMALSLFLNWLRSSWQSTTIPVGL